MTGPSFCPKCKGFHYRNSSCIVRVTKSTAARKDVRGSGDVIQSSERSVGRSDAASKANPTTDMGIAGTQALPVDTTTKRPVGRPKTITDMKAYKAAKAREYRARKANGTSH